MWDNVSKSNSRNPHYLEIKSPFGYISFSRVSFPFVACLKPSAPAWQSSLPCTSLLERNLPAEFQFQDNGESFLFRSLHVKQEFIYVNRRNTCFAEGEIRSKFLNIITYY